MTYQPIITFLCFSDSKNICLNILLIFFLNIYLFVLIQIQDSQCSSDESEELRLVFILISLATPIESVYLIGQTN